MWDSPKSILYFDIAAKHPSSLVGTPTTFWESWSSLHWSLHQAPTSIRDIGYGKVTHCQILFWSFSNAMSRHFFFDIHTLDKYFLHVLAIELNLSPHLHAPLCSPTSSSTPPSWISSPSHMLGKWYSFQKSYFHSSVKWHALHCSK